MRALPGRREWSARRRDEAGRAFLGLLVGFLVICVIAVLSMFATHVSDPHTAPVGSGGVNILRQIPGTLSFIFMLGLLASIAATMPMLAIMWIERRSRIDLGMITWTLVNSVLALFPCLMLAALAGGNFLVTVSAFSCGGFAGAAAYAARSSATRSMNRSDLRLIATCWAILFASSSLLVWILNVPAYLRSIMVV